MDIRDAEALLASSGYDLNQMRREGATDGEIVLLAGCVLGGGRPASEWRKPMWDDGLARDKETTEAVEVAKETDMNRYGYSESFDGYGYEYGYESRGLWDGWEETRPGVWRWVGDKEERGGGRGDSEMDGEPVGEFKVGGARVLVGPDFRLYREADGYVKARVSVDGGDLREMVLGQKWGNKWKRGSELLAVDYTVIPPLGVVRAWRDRLMEVCDGEAYLMLGKRVVEGKEEWVGVVPKQEASAGGVDVDDTGPSVDWMVGNGWSPLGSTMHLHPGGMLEASGTDEAEWKEKPGVYIIAPRGLERISLWGSVRGGVWKVGERELPGLEGEGVWMFGEDGRVDGLDELIRSPRVYQVGVKNYEDESRWMEPAWGKRKKKEKGKKGKEKGKEKGGEGEAFDAAASKLTFGGHWKIKAFKGEWVAMLRMAKGVGNEVDFEKVEELCRNVRENGYRVEDVMTIRDARKGEGGMFMVERRFGAVLCKVAPDEFRKVMDGADVVSEIKGDK